MSEKVTGWDTVGATKIGIMNQSRIRREFTGTDGLKRSIFVPIESIAPEIAGLVAVVKQATAMGLVSERIGSEMSGNSLFDIKGVSIGASDDSQEFILSLQTVDGLQLRFQLDRQKMESLVTAFSAVAAKHDLTPSTERGTLN